MDAHTSAEWSHTRVCLAAVVCDVKAPREPEHSGAEGDESQLQSLLILSDRLRKKRREKKKNVGCRNK